jgi:hypothetical protein
MKAVIVLLAAALLCGCSKPPSPDPKIAAMEARMSMLESNVAELKDDNRYLMDEDTKTVAILTNVYENLTYVVDKVHLHDDYFSVLRRQLTNSSDADTNIDPATGLPWMRKPDP